MRITGGELRGIQLKVPAGRVVRPTTDRIREAVFAMLGNISDCGGRILDLYAGSGALGIEALSRGAKWVDFIDQNRKSCNVIEYNLQKSRLQDRAHIYCCSVNHAMIFLDSNYDIVFLDPPYSYSSTDDLLLTLSGNKILRQMSTVVVSHANRFLLKSDFSDLHLVKQRRYGDSYISIYQREI